MQIIFEIMFFITEFPGLVILILQFLILYHLIKIYRPWELRENHQEPLTEVGNRINRGRTNDDRAGPHIRFPTEQDERQG